MLWIISVSITISLRIFEGIDTPPAHISGTRIHFLYGPFPSRHRVHGRSCSMPREIIRYDSARYRFSNWRSVDRSRNSTLFLAGMLARFASETVGCLTEKPLTMMGPLGRRVIAPWAMGFFVTGIRKSFLGRTIRNMSFPSESVPAWEWLRYDILDLRQCLLANGALSIERPENSTYMIQ